MVKKCFFLKKMCFLPTKWVVPTGSKGSILVFDNLEQLSFKKNFANIDWKWIPPGGGENHYTQKMLFLMIFDDICHWNPTQGIFLDSLGPEEYSWMVSRNILPIKGVRGAKNYQKMLFLMIFWWFLSFQPFIRYIFGILETRRVLRNILPIKGVRGAKNYPTMFFLLLLHYY